VALKYFALCPLKAIVKLEKLSAKNLTWALRERIEGKPDIEKEYDALMDISRMWFETPLEFRPRLDEAIAVYAANEEERKRREEEEAFEKKKREEEEALEKKRAEGLQKKISLLNIGQREASAITRAGDDLA